MGQIDTLCAILNSLDASAVFLPQEITENIQSLKREAFWPNWFAGEQIREMLRRSDVLLSARSGTWKEVTLTRMHLQQLMAAPNSCLSFNRMRIIQLFCFY